MLPAPQPLATKTQEAKSAIPPDVIELLSIGPKHELHILSRVYPDLTFECCAEGVRIGRGETLTVEDVVKALPAEFSFVSEGNSLIVSRKLQGSSLPQANSSTPTVPFQEVSLFPEVSLPARPERIELTERPKSRAPDLKLVKSALDAEIDLICKALNWSGAESQFLKDASKSGVEIRMQSLDRASSEGCLQLKNVDAYQGSYRRLLVNLGFAPQGQSSWCANWRKAPVDSEYKPDQATVFFSNNTEISIHFGSIQGVGSFMATDFVSPPVAPPA